MKQITTTEARTMVLMGQPGSWNGYARRPLEDVPDTVLRQALHFFRDRNADEPNGRLEMQITAIGLVLDYHEATSPQQRLAL